MKRIIAALLIFAACRKETPAPNQQQPTTETRSAEVAPILPDVEPSQAHAQGIAELPAVTPTKRRAVASTPVATPVTPELRGTEIRIPCDFHHGAQRMNVRLQTADGYPWGSPPFDSPIMVRIFRDRRGVRSLIQSALLPPSFPGWVAFAVNEQFEYGDVIVIPWQPGICTLPGCTTVSIIDNGSGDPYTRDVYVTDVPQ